MLANNTERLDLLKKDPSVDGDDTFNIDTMLNENWDKIDEKVAMVDEEGKVINKDGSAVGGEVSEQDVEDKIDAHSKEVDVHGLGSTSVALGEGATAEPNLQGDYAIAIGRDSLATRNTVAIGHNAKAERFNGDGTVAIGPSANARGEGGVATGKNAFVDRYPGVAIGLNSYSCNGYGSVALGTNAKVNGTQSIALGGNTIVGTGTSSRDNADHSSAIGSGASSLNENTGVLGGAGSNNASKWEIPGQLTVSGTKNFEMPHPHPDKKETHRLRHSAVESPTAGDNLYRFEIEATEALQEIELELPDYFQYLNKDVDVWVNGVDHFGNAYGKVEGNTLKVTCELAGEYNVLVIGTRNDDHQSVQNWGIKGVEREIGESWTGETYVFEVDEILEIEEIKEEDVA